MNNNSVCVTWTVYDPADSHALVAYGTFTSGKLIQENVIASYDRADAFPPQARIVFDNATQHVQIAWGESESDGQSASTINYAKLGENGTLLTKLQVAKFAAELRDVSITSISGHDGAFVVWQTTASDYSLYVSQISANGQLVYLKELNYTTGQSRNLAISTDLENNFYVVWYQPILSPQSASTSAEPTASTNVTYVRMNLDGNIIQTGTGVFQAPVIGVTVLSDGVVYGVSPDGLVKVAVPTKPQSNVLTVTALVIMSCVSLAGFAGSVIVEEGRYRWGALYSRISSAPAARENPERHQEVFRLIARRPGLKVRDVKRLMQGQPVGITSLLAMERIGLLASFRDGLSRRFYVKGSETCQDAIRSRILLRILDHPDIWEARLAKDLGLSQQIVHYHLKKLRETKLIMAAVDENGSRKLYRFVDSSHHDSKKTEPL
jgi:DNA-binding transcriptional ArsR family regulator